MPKLKTLLIISASIALLMLIALTIQYIAYDNTIEELQECRIDNEELERKNKELEDELQNCKEENDKCRKLLLILSVRKISEDDY